MGILVYFTLLIMIPFRVTSSSADPVSEALLSLKSELIDNSNTLSNWILPSNLQPSSQIHACSWVGIICDENSSKIISLNLSMKNLSGSLSGNQFNLFTHLINLNLAHNSFQDQLPLSISNLTTLKSLDISKNNFSGQFPQGISNLQNLIILNAFSNSFSGPLPVDISQIESLQVLNLAGSYFSGTIPSSYGSLKNLEFLHLAGNLLTGEIPFELGKLKKLSHMEIGYNSYEGGIPWQFGNMSHLQYLDIADANISGPIPSQLGNLTNIESLFLFSNQINGEIPGELSKMMLLKSLDLSDNFISGKIPESFSELRDLRLLSLMYNEMSGMLPQSIAELQQLDTLLIWNNFFTGPLPEDLGRYSKLKHVDVSTNYFDGNIPPYICAGGELQKMILFSNNFSGELFPSISNCSSLVRLRLEGNSFSGKISVQFGNLSYVDLSRNNFNGGIPCVITQALSLRYFNVSNNLNLGGIVPSEIWSLPNAENFSMNSCGLSGKIVEFNRCRSLSVIELRMNNLSGNIPESISNCMELVKIDLSHNKLNGSIPENFGSLLRLSVFNVSYNDISGLIPQNFKMMDGSAFFGNQNLCGAPLSPCHSENEISIGLELARNKSKKIAWILTSCAAVIFLTIAAIFGVLHYKIKSKWRMVSFNGLPQFTAKDILKSFALPDSVNKVVLPTGISVSVKRIEWNRKSMKMVLRFLIKIGNVRNKNLTRLLGVCYNEKIAYLLYDYLPNGNLAEEIRIKRDWETKCKIVIGVGKGLYFLHHDCFPPIPHSNLKASNVLLNENMEPHLSEYGINTIIQMINSQHSTKTTESGGMSTTYTREEVLKDVFNLGELIVQVLTDGRLSSVQNIPREVLIREIADENDINTSPDLNSFIQLALLCTRNKASDRPSMRDVLKHLLLLKASRNDQNL